MRLVMRKLQARHGGYVQCDLSVPNIVECWRSVSLAQQGWWQALHDAMVQVYDRMVQSGFRPTATTYTALISAYGKAGQLDNALDVFNQMVSCSTLETSGELHTQSQDAALEGLKPHIAGEVLLLQMSRLCFECITCGTCFKPQVFSEHVCLPVRASLQISWWSASKRWSAPEVEVQSFSLSL